MPNRMLPILFLIWLVIKLGQIPLIIILALAKLLYWLYRQVYFLLTKVSFPKLSLPKKERINLPKLEYPMIIEAPQPKAEASRTWDFVSKFRFNSKRKRGRPRTQPLLPFYRGKLERFLKIFIPGPVKLAIIVGLILSFTLGYSYFLVTLAHDLPSPERLSEIEGPLTTFIYDRNGKLLYRLYEGRNRTLVTLDELPKQLVQATIAIEDKNFYSHPGVDLYAVARALVANLKSEELQGGSTITQQLIKNTLLTPERTFERKIKEILLAYWAERLYNKDQILQMYFNEAPYGGTAWGIEAAAEVYFNKKASQLDLAESAFLAGLPASPTDFSPFGPHPELAKERQKEVLIRMVEEGYIGQNEADKVSSEPLTFTPPSDLIKAPHFVMYVRSLLSKKYGEKVVSQGGLNITTTLDLDIQQIVEDIVAEEVGRLAPLKVGNGAAMVTDAKTGQILAMVGSKNYFDSKDGNYNVTIALRQPGSSIKPITYVTGFKQGYSPGTILLDSPTVFKNSWETYAPVNYDGKFRGPLPIRSTLAESRNVPAVKMLALVGISNMISTARDLGLTTLNDESRYGLSLTLGGGEVKMVDMMVVFGTFANNGIKFNSTPLLKVTDSAGLVLEDSGEQRGVRVLPAGLAYLITDILADARARVPAFGSNNLLTIPGHQVAVKTGTTDSKRDNWCFGYTPEFVVGVWVGNNNNAPMDPQLTSGVTGATPIWNRIMSSLLINREPIAFTRPGDVIEGVVDGKRDLVINGQAPKTIVGIGKKKIQDDKSKEEKEVITFTDPFSAATSDQFTQPQVNP